MDSSASTSKASASNAGFSDDDEVLGRSHQTILEVNNDEEYLAAATTHVDWDEILGDSRALGLEPTPSSEGSAPDSADDGAQVADSGPQGVSLSVGYVGFVSICLRSFRLARRENPDQLDLSEQRHRLAIWADEVDDEPSLGELLSLRDASSLGKSVLIALASIATNLLDFLERNAESIGAEIETMVQQLPSKVKTIHLRLYPPGSSHSDYTESDLELNLEAITDSIDSLYSLIPYIDDLQSEYEESKLGGDQAFDSLTQEYQRYITQREWKLDREFVTRLAQLNAQRHQRIRVWADQPVPLPPTNTSQPTGSKTSGTSFAESSLFDKAETAYSASSVASTTPDKGERIRYPKPPLPIFPRKSACCTICHDATADVSTLRKWRAHVRADLEPYICMEPKCPVEDAQFKSVRDWKQHDKECHHNIISFSCVHPCTKVFSEEEDLQTHILKHHLKGESSLSPSSLGDVVARCAQYDDTSVLKQQYQCQFCDESKIGKTALRRHLGRHMVDLALKVLPQEYYGSDSDEYHGDSGGEESDVSIENIVTPAPSSSTNIEYSHTKNPIISADATAAGSLHESEVPPPAPLPAELDLEKVESHKKASVLSVTSPCAEETGSWGYWEKDRERGQVSVEGTHTSTMSIRFCRSEAGYDSSQVIKTADLAERRKIQNRIAERNYRRKLRHRLEELERRATSRPATSKPTSPG